MTRIRSATEAPSDVQLRKKRCVDLALTVGALPLWLPLLCAASLAVYVDSGRPILFQQTRMGRGRKPFTLLKLRTMQQAPAPPRDALFAGWTYANDPRITRIGRLLRRFRLDELPQLLNVLGGEMSLVGPRPEPWEIAVALGEQIPGYHARHDVLPGLTGLCQVSAAYYDFGSVEKSRIKLGYDLEYVRHSSVSLDLAILARTFRVIGRGAGIA